MKKIITLLFVALFTVVSCTSTDSTETLPVTVPSATTAQAVLDGGAINISWPAVMGTGITYNVYRNDNPVKINTTALTEAKYTDVLTATGSYTYTITVNFMGSESPKGIASEKVVLELPKTSISEDYSYVTNNGVSTIKTYKNNSVFNYDSTNITKLVSVSSISSDSGSTTATKTKYVNTYNDNLITKEESVDELGNVETSTVYTYNDKNKITSRTFTTKSGYILKSVFVYNTDNTVTSTQYSKSISGDVTANGYIIVYTYLNGNLIKEVSTNNVFGNNSTNTYEYVFDTKNSPTKFILGYSKLFGEAANVNNSVNNIYSSSSNKSYTRSEFTYNVNGNVLTQKTFSKSDDNPTEKLSGTTTYTY